MGDEIEGGQKAKPDEMLSDDQRLEVSQTKESKLDLREFLVYKNPNAEYYGELIANEERIDDKSQWDWSSLKTPFSGGWRELLSRYHKPKDAAETLGFLEIRLKGQLLVDLGGAQSMDFFATMIGAKTFIDVDKYSDDKEAIDPNINLEEKYKYKDGHIERMEKLLSNRTIDDKGLIEDAKKEIQTFKSLDYLIVQADMLDFVSKMPDNSANFSLNGIDGHMIHQREYHQALANELSRATIKGGVVLGMESSAFSLLSPEKFTRAELESRKRGFKIFEKNI